MLLSLFLFLFCADASGKLEGRPTERGEFGIVLTIEKVSDISDNLLLLSTLIPSLKNEGHLASLSPSVLAIALDENLEQEFTKKMWKLPPPLVTLLSSFDVSTQVSEECEPVPFPIFCLLQQSPFPKSLHLHPLLRFTGEEAEGEDLKRFMRRLDEGFEIAVTFGNVPLPLGDRSMSGGGLEGGRWVALSEVILWCGECKGAKEILGLAAWGGGTEKHGGHNFNVPIGGGESDYAALTRALANSSPPPRLLPLPPSFNLQPASSISFLHHGSPPGGAFWASNNSPETYPDPVGLILSAFSSGADESASLPPPLACREVGDCGVLLYGFGKCESPVSFFGCEWGRALRRSLSALDKGMRGLGEGPLDCLSITVAIDESNDLEKVVEKVHREWGFPWVRIVPFGKESEVGKCVEEAGGGGVKLCLMRHFVPNAFTVLLDLGVHLRGSGVVGDWINSLLKFDLLIRWPEMEAVEEGGCRKAEGGWKENLERSGVVIYRNSLRLKRFLDYLQTSKNADKNEKVPSFRFLPLPPHHLPGQCEWRESFPLFMRGEGVWFDFPGEIPDFLARNSILKTSLPKKVEKMKKNEALIRASFSEKEARKAELEKLKKMEKSEFVLDESSWHSWRKDFSDLKSSFFSSDLRIEIPRHDREENVISHILWAAKGGVFSEKVAKNIEEVIRRGVREREKGGRRKTTLSYSKPSVAIFGMCFLVISFFFLQHFLPPGFFKKFWKVGEKDY